MNTNIPVTRYPLPRPLQQENRQFPSRLSYDLDTVNTIMSDLNIELNEIQRQFIIKRERERGRQRERSKEQNESFKSKCYLFLIPLPVTKRLRTNKTEGGGRERGSVKHGERRRKIHRERGRERGRWKKREKRVTDTDRGGVIVCEDFSSGSIRPDTRNPQCLASPRHIPPECRVTLLPSRTIG